MYIFVVMDERQFVNGICPLLLSYCAASVLTMCAILLKNATLAQVDATESREQT